MLKRALSLKPNDHRTLTDLGQAFAAEGKYGQSLVCLERALELSPYDLGIAVAVSTVDRYAGVPDARKPIPATGPSLMAADEEWDDEEDWEDEETSDDQDDGWDDEEWEEEEEEWEEEVWEDEEASDWEDNSDSDGLIDIN